MKRNGILPERGGPPQIIQKEYSKFLKELDRSASFQRDLHDLLSEKRK